MRLFRFVFDILYFYFFGGVKFARKKGVKVGSGCRVYIRSWGTEPFLVTIGNRVTITSGVKIITHDGSTCLVHDAEGFRYQNYRPVEIGDDVFIGVNSIILPGVKIGSNVIVGAGSVVSHDLNDRGVYVGSPARKVADFDVYKRKVFESCVSDQVLNSDFSTYKEKVLKAIELQNEKK